MPGTRLKAHVADRRRALRLVTERLSPDHDAHAYQRKGSGHERSVWQRDVAALERLLHDELVYVHATGLRHDRAQLLHFIDSGPRFLKIEIPSPRIVQLGGGALLTGHFFPTLQRPAATQ